MSDGIDEPGYINWRLALSLLISWLLVFLCLCRGIKSLGKISYVTAIFPYIMIFALMIRGVLLDGAKDGIKFYIGNTDLSKLLTLKTWIDAASQVYFCLGVGLGCLFTLGKHNKFHYNHERVSLFVPTLDGLTGLLAGFVIFAVLGAMSHQYDIEVKNLAVGGPGLAFIVYPEALSLMPLPALWCVFFFLMMITIGFGSLLSLMECILDTTSELFPKVLFTKARKTYYRLIVCILFFLFGLSMTTRAGYYVFNLIDSYVVTIPIFMIAFLEVAVVGWFYGIKRISEDLKLMLGSRPNIYWRLCWRFFTPVLCLVVLFIAIIQNSEVTLEDYRYPTYAQAIGWIIVVTCLIPLPICFIFSIYRHGFKETIKKLTTPTQDWKPAFDDETEDSIGDEFNNVSNKNVLPNQKQNKETLHDENNSMEFNRAKLNSAFTNEEENISNIELKTQI